MKRRSKAEDIASIVNKAIAYENYYRDTRPPEDFPCLLDAVKSSAEEGDLRWLEELSRELDTISRETLTLEEQRDLLSRMHAQGVLPKHLLKMTGLQTVRRLLKKKQLSTARERSLAITFLEGAELNLLSPEEQEELGRLVDCSLVKRAT